MVGAPGEVVFLGFLRMQYRKYLAENPGLPRAHQELIGAKLGFWWIYEDGNSPK